MTLASLAPATGLRLLSQQIERGHSHTGEAAETLVLEAAQPALARLLLPLADAAVIEEFRASLWVRCDQPGVRLACRVRLPQAQRSAGVPLELFVAGPPGGFPGRWQELSLTGIPRLLAQRLPALRAEYGADVSTAAAVITGLVVEIPMGTGRCTASLDDLSVEGLIAAGTGAMTAGESSGSPIKNPAVSPAAAAGLVRGVLEVAGRPFFPRAIDHNGDRAGSARLQLRAAARTSVRRTVGRGSSGRHVDHLSATDAAESRPARTRQAAGIFGPLGPRAALGHGQRAIGRRCSGTGAKAADL